ncbi:MAG: DnaD domain protein [Lachnospiraceae bacterium]|nr:DnaD domain protein [Lachnospiraceae bacterium]
MRIEGLYPTGYTSVPHSFIDQYMISANGEFVKTYLLLLRFSEGGDFSVSQLADKLDQTESDVRRGLRYWAGRGLLRLVEKDGEVESVAVLFPRTDPEEEPVPGEIQAKPAEEEKPPSSEEAEVLPARSYTAKQLRELKEKPDFDQLLFALEHYLGRTLGTRDVDLMAYLYDELGFPGEVLEYLAEYCVERFEREEKKKDYKLMRYMEKVALNWHTQGAITLEQAKQQTLRFAQDSAAFIAVGKALGLKNRQLTENECRRVSSWIVDLNMPQDLILEACERTIRKKNTPDFPYTEGILKRWKKEGVTSLSSLKDNEAAGEKKAPGAEASSGAGTQGSGKGKRYLCR